MKTMEQIFGFIPPRAVTYIQCLDCGRGNSVRLGEFDFDKVNCPSCGSDNTFITAASNEEGGM